MRKMKRFLSAVAAVLTVTMAAQSASACTIVMLGKDATTDGSTIATHNDDSSGADFRLWIIPSMEGGEGITRDIVMDSHNYGDYGDYPNTKDYGNGMLINTMDQPEDTYAYLHSRYSFINEKGVAIGESTFYPDDSEQGKKVMEHVYGSNTGIIDCWNAQDIALERASTAREAVEIMGKLCEEYQWYDWGETMDIVDGEEAWVFEAYGLGLWAAVRIPDNAFFVSANRARINEFDFDDHENYLCSPDLKSFAVEHEMWSEEDGPFYPAQVYAPDKGAYSYLREWRAFDLVAPSLGLEVQPDEFYPLYVIPDEKVSPWDVFRIKGDYYEGTDYDVSRTAYAGDYGNPLNVNNIYRTINLFRTCYLMMANIKSWLPDEVKCLVWYGYGAPDSSFLVPLWPSMTRLPDLYNHGSRYEDFDRTSGWWINSYVQQVASINYNYARPIIQERRDEKMKAQFEEVAELQEKWAAMIEEGKKDEAIAELTEYACTNAEEWYDMWLSLGDELLGDLMWGMTNMRNPGYSDWYKGIMNGAEMKPLPAAE